MTLSEIMLQLQEWGNESTKNVLIKHGAREPFFGVKVEDLKKIQKKAKKDYQLSLDLYNTGNSDAMYLAGLIADPAKMTRPDLNDWVEKVYDQRVYNGLGCIRKSFRN
jgi:3-methyladenine DNA glycosylase AlkD